MCDLNPSSVIDWNGRPKRTVKQPVSYWAEYVETDKWYRDELMRDVPESERKAACEDEDYSEDEGESGDETESGEESECEGDDDEEYEDDSEGDSEEEEEEEEEDEEEDEEEES